jgi:eukaryotic-like serine/threonine-protein kinase
MTLNREDWAQALRLLDDALELPPAERALWLAALPPQHARLDDTLRGLLSDRRAIETGDFLQARAALPAPDPATWAAGTLLGPYRLLRPLGEGGMASVWLAERADALHKRQVALKLPYVSAHSTAIAERFERERSILSSLSHPHIASVLDAGVDGRQPWLAMEFVDGLPIAAHCAARGLGVAARLRLFLQVLQAVQHAHAQLVIHRDIKPSNVLVDGNGAVKLLDFGVAKLLEPDGHAVETALTQWGGRAMTLQYASPEQVAGRPLGTASDVYSLGVLLYEILTGKLPYRLERRTAAAIEEAILAAQVAAPSQLAGDKATARALRGDIDTIVLKAMHAMPAERYASAESFAQDIERWLVWLPIRARPASPGYRLRRALTRHRALFAGTAAVSVALLAGLAGTAWQARLAQAQAQQAEAVQQFLAEVLSGNDPQQAQGRELSARELLDASAKRIDADFANWPPVRARLHQSVASIYVALGRMNEARPHIASAIALYQTIDRPDREQQANALLTQTEVLEELREYDAARQATEQALAFTAEHFGEVNRWRGRLLSRLSWIAGEQGNLPLSASLGEQGLAAQRLSSGERSPEYQRALSSLAHAHLARGDMRRARELFTSAVEIGALLPGAQTTDRLVDGYNLARVTFVMGDSSAAEAQLRALLPHFDRHVGPQHQRSVVARSLHAQALAELGRHAESVQAQRDNVAHVRARPGEAGEDLALQQLTLAKLLRLAARYDEGVPLAREGLAYFERHFAQPTWYRERGRWILGELLLGAGQRVEGLKHIDAAVANVSVMEGALGHPARAEMMVALAIALRRGDRPGESAPLVAAACPVIVAALGETAPAARRCAVVRAWLDALALDAALRAPALAGFVAARESAVAALPERHALRAELLLAQAELLTGMPGHAEQAAALRTRAQTLYAASVGLPLPAVLMLLH